MIPIPKNERENLFAGNDYRDNFAVAVEKDGDMLTFKPQRHYPWNAGIYNTDSVGSVLKDKPRTFMFTDRGIYKPGEIVTFRGIDRDQKLGKITPYCGEYSVALRSSDWQNPVTYETKFDKTSESGGFFGSFTIPEDVKPGTYLLGYKRADDNAEENLYFTVSYFERAKFQSAVTMPENKIIAGEKIEALLSASYLAGGVPAGAVFENSWYRNPCNFVPKSNQLKNYSFGMINSGEGSSEVTAEEGTLDGEGKAKLSCATSGNKTEGIAYMYNA